jgi:hypothetical protein
VQPTQRPLTAMPANSGAADPSAAQQPAAPDTSTASSSSDLTATAYPGSEADLQQQEQQQQQQLQGGGQQGSTVGSSSRGSTSTSSRGSSISIIMNSAIPSDQEPDRKLHVPCLAAFHSMIHALAAGGDLRSAVSWRLWLCPLLSFNSALLHCRRPWQMQPRALGLS